MRHGEHTQRVWLGRVLGCFKDKRTDCDRWPDVARGQCKPGPAGCERQPFLPEGFDGEVFGFWGLLQ